MRSMLTTVSAIALVLVQAAGAQKAVRTIEDGALDRIELFTGSIERAGELSVVIKPFESNDADLGTGGKEGKETRQQEAQTMKNEGPRVLAESFVAALQKAGPFKQVDVLKDGQAAPEGTLVVEGRFLVLDPGSRTKRYFAGFGAGKSSVKVAGTVKDSSGQVIATFEQRRIGAMGLGGGDSLGKLMSDSRSIGGDIAKFLSMWARGEDID